MDRFLFHKIYYRCANWIQIIRENIFFDFKLIALYATLIAIVIFFSYPYSTLFHMPDKEAMIYIVENISRASAVFIGIIISLVLLSFQIFHNNFGRYAFIGFFNNPQLKFLFTLYIINLLLSIYSISYLKNTGYISLYSISIFLLTIGTTFLLIILIFPIAIRLIKNSQSKATFFGLFNTINKDSIYEWDIYKMNPHLNRDIKRIEEDQTNIIVEIGKKLIQNDDIISVELLLKGYFDRLCKLIITENKGDNSVNAYFTSEFREILRQLVLNSIKLGNITSLRTCLRWRGELENYIVKEKLLTNYNGSKTFKYDYLPMLFDLETFFDKSLLETDNEIREEIIYTYSKHCEMLITHYFVEYLPKYEHAKYTEYHEEKHAAYEFLCRLPRQFNDKAALANKIDIFKKILNSYYLQGVVLDSKNAASVKIFLLYYLEEAKEDSFKTYLEMSPKRVEYLCFPYTLYIDSELKQLNRDSLLIKFLNALDIAYSKGYLNTMMINSLKAFAMSCIGQLEVSNLHAEALKKIVNKFDHLRDLSDGRDSIQEKFVYVQLHKYLTYVFNEMVKVRPTDSENAQLVNIVLSKFNRLNEYQADLTRNGYIGNHDIV